MSDGEGGLSETDFGTEFGTRVFRAISEVYRKNGAFDVAVLSESFKQDEISRITKLALDRQKLTNDMSVYLSNVAALKKERGKREHEGEDAFDAIRRLRNKNNKSNT